MRHELLPLLNELADRDVAALLARTADLLRDDDTLLEQLAADLDPTDALALRGGAAPARPPGRPAVARTTAAIRRTRRRCRGCSTWPPAAPGCDVGAGRRVTRHQQQLVLVNNSDPAS